ncbi:MAG: hypothetical protein H7Y00_13950 [Fimbriimonadaceae bacterium]|nr:hypothetical protein [Chitinophagales bacterium]
MNLIEEILKEHSKKQALKIVKWVSNDKKKFHLLMQLFLTNEYRVTQRSAYAISICADKNTALIKPYLRKMLLKTKEPGIHDAVKRNVVRILQFIDIPKNLQGLTATICFDLLASIDEPIAVKCFSMSVLSNLAQKEPDLKNELLLLIEEQLPYAKAGFKSRAKKVIKQLQ